MMKILLATDGSQSAMAAIDFLLRLPLPPACDFTLLTVIEKEAYKSRKKTELNPEQLELLRQTKTMLQDEAEEVLTKAASKLQDAGCTSSSLTRSGHPSREIVRMAKKHAVDLVVVGSHGLGGVKRFLLGSVSDQVLAYAPCSVLIVKPCSDNPATDATIPREVDKALRILLAYDDSVSSKQAVDFCAALPLDESVEITALTVLPLVKLYRQDIKQRLSWVWKEKKKLAQKSLDRLSNEVEWTTPHISTHLREAADVSQEILDLAEQTQCHLILLGHKGKGAIEKFLLGSVTTRIAHHAPCSVLAVRNRKATSSPITTAE